MPIPLRVIPFETPPTSPEEAFRSYGSFVFRLLRRLGVLDAEVEDATQDVFLVVVRKFSSFEHRSSFRTWLYGIALRVAADRRKKNRRRRLGESILAEDPERALPTSSASKQSHREGLSTLALVLGELDDDKVALLVLIELEELEVTDAAELLSIPLNTAYSRLRRARAEFSSTLERLKAKDE